MIVVHRALTPRQREVAERIAAGLTRAEVAAELDIAEDTVASHLKAIAMRVPGDGPLRRRIREYMRAA